MRVRLAILFPAIPILLACAGADTSSVEFRGTELTARNPAASFSLTNQFGQQMGLDTLSEKVVLVTFLYTNCPDVCPITTSQLRDAHESLGESSDDVAFVAISVDPDRDTVESALSYLERWEMADTWSYLVGEEDQLRPVWKSYYLDPSINESSRQTATPESPIRATGVDALKQEFTERYLVIHSAPIYLIDRDRTLRVVFTLPFDTEDLVHDIGLLLG